MKIAQMCKLGLMSLVLVASSLMSPLSAYATTGATVKNAPVLTNPACKPELALNVQVDPKSTLQDAKARVDFGGALPNDHKCKAGDQIIVTVPSEIALPQGKVFPLGTPDAVVAIATVNGDKIIITLTDFVQKNKDIKLTGWVEVKMKVTVQPGKEIKLEWNINGEVVFTYAKIETPPVEPKETRVVTWYTHRDARDKEGTEKTGGIAHRYPQYLDIAKLKLGLCQDYVTQTDTMVGTRAELDAIMSDGMLATGGEDANVTKSWVVKFHKTSCEAYRPSIDIQKFDGDLVTGDRDTFDEAKLLGHDEKQELNVVITNTGNEPLAIMWIADSVVMGNIDGNAMEFVCKDFNIRTYDLLMPGKQILCTITLPALGYDAVHGDSVEVVAYGRESDTQVEARDEWYAYTNPKVETPVTPVTPTTPSTPTTLATPVAAKAIMPTELPQTGASMNMPMWLPMVLSMAVYGVMYKFQRRAEEK